jgi:hypothetical protein
MAEKRIAARNLIDAIFIFIDFVLNCSQVRCGEQPFWIQNYCGFQLNHANILSSKKPHFFFSKTNSSFRAETLILSPGLPAPSSLTF